DDTVFCGGACIYLQRHAGSSSKIISKAISLATITTPVRLVVRAAIEGRIDAQVATDPYTSIRARDIPKAGAIERTDPDVFDRLGFNREVGTKRSARDE